MSSRLCSKGQWKPREVCVSTFSKASSDVSCQPAAAPVSRNCQAVAAEGVGTSGSL